MRQRRLARREGVCGFVRGGVRSSERFHVRSMSRSVDVSISRFDGDTSSTRPYFRISPFAHHGLCVPRPKTQASQHTSGLGLKSRETMSAMFYLASRNPLRRSAISSRARGFMPMYTIVDVIAACPR